MTSIWIRGAQASAVICVLILFANFQLPAQELVGMLIISFVVWLVISAGVVWLYRKMKSK